MRYADRYSLDLGEADMQVVPIKANGINAPFAGGHQPLFHDQFAALYQYYTVV